jgi:hypothetical protein
MSNLRKVDRPVFHRLGRRQSLRHGRDADFSPTRPPPSLQRQPFCSRSCERKKLGTPLIEKSITLAFGVVQRQYSVVMAESPLRCRYQDLPTVSVTTCGLLSPVLWRPLLKKSPAAWAM